MSKDVKIHCPLCHIPMQYTLRPCKQNPKTKQVSLLCAKCGNDLKGALKEQWLKC